MLKKLNEILGLAVLCVSLFLFLDLYMSQQTYGHNFDKMAPYDQGWTRLGPEGDSEISFPQIGVQKQDSLRLEREVDYLIKERGGLAIFTADTLVKAYLNDREVYSTELVRGPLSKYSSGSIWQYIDLGENLQVGDQLRLEFSSNYQMLAEEFDLEWSQEHLNKIWASSIFLSEGYDAARFIMYLNGPLLILASALLVMALVALLFSVFVYRRIDQRKYLIYLAFAIGFMGIFALASNGFMRLFFVDAYLLKEIRYSALLLSILFVSGSLIERNGRKKEDLAHLWAFLAVILLGLRLLSYFFEPLLILDYFLSADLILMMSFYFLVLPASLEISKQESENRGLLVFFMLGALLLPMDYLTERFRTYQVSYFKVVGLAIFFSSILVQEMSIYLSIYEANKEKDHYKELASRDEATGLKNRNSFADHLPLYEQNLEDLSLLVMDVNGLKQVNDQQGHSKGDELLSASAGLMKAFFGDLGQLYRIGGDEFLLVMQGVDSKLVIDRLDQFKKSMEEESQKRTFEISIALGMAEYMPYCDASLDSIMNRADERMYQEKKMTKRGLTFKL